MAHVAHEMHARGLRAAAAHRRRDDLARAHRGQDRAELRAAGDLRARRVARGERVHQPDLRRSAPTLRRRDQGATTSASASSTPRRKARHRSCRSPKRARTPSDRLDELRADRGRRSSGGSSCAPTTSPRSRDPSTGRRSSRPGISPAAIRRSSTTRWSAKPRATCSRDGAGDARADHPGEVADARTPSSASIRRTRWATTSRSTPTNARREPSMTCSPPAPAERRRPADRDNFASRDFVAPKASGRADYLGAFAVTAGIGCDERVRVSRRRTMITTRSWSAAFARPPRRGARQARCIGAFGASSGATAADEALDETALTRKACCGIRPAPGIRPCPDHTERGRSACCSTPRRRASRSPRTTRCGRRRR